MTMPSNSTIALSCLLALNRLTDYIKPVDKYEVAIPLNVRIDAM